MNDTNLSIFIIELEQLEITWLLQRPIEIPYFAVNLSDDGIVCKTFADAASDFVWGGAPRLGFNDLAVRKLSPTWRLRIGSGTWEAKNSSDWALSRSHMAMRSAKKDGGGLNSPTFPDLVSTLAALAALALFRLEWVWNWVKGNAKLSRI